MHQVVKQPTGRQLRLSPLHTGSHGTRGRGRRRLRIWSMIGPAFVAAIAYVDPGNFATNFSGGANFGYELLWVIVAANLVAMLIQSLTAKLGAATSRDLASLCREEMPRPVVWGLWLQAEAVAVATDLAEVVGGAIALHLLFGVPLPIGGGITAVLAFTLLGAQTRGHRPFELVVAGLLLMIGAGLAYDLMLAGVDLRGATGGLSPGFSGMDSLVLATGILGATVMPHVIYVHSALTRRRYDVGGQGARDHRAVSGRREVLRAQRLDVVMAMGVAGLINATMLVVAAQLFAGSGGRRLARTSS